ncbi:MAG: 30S ribosomal protein S4e [Nanoarchaeota archaeon]|nr:30S ribosomal protein S4e [Nanoarchaeota archaeon]
MAYLKRLAMPKTWPLARKGTTYIVTPLPGRKLKNSIPVSLVIKYIGFAKTNKEVKFILNAGRVKVNNRTVKELAFPIGLFDVISFIITKRYFRLLFKNKKLFLHEINEQESKIKPAKAIKKTLLKGNKLQINLDDGTNLLSKIDCKTGDTLVFDLETNKIDVIKFEQGNLAYLVGGKHLGSLVKIKEIKGKLIFCESDSKKFNVLKENIFVIGKNKPVISLPNENE